jgi:N-acetylmuramoyl-L-alanine amidase
MQALILLFSLLGGGGDADPALQASFQRKADTYLVKNDEVRGYFDIRADGVYMFASPEAKAADSAECVVYWHEAELFEQLQWVPKQKAMRLYLTKGDQPWQGPFWDSLMSGPSEAPIASPGKPLSGLRIALDPGHLGGSMDMAKTERKMIRMRGTDHPTGEDIAFNEGNLTLATAWILADSLRALGAEVMMTRTEPGQTPWGIPYAEWKRTHFKAAVDSMAIRKDWTPEQKQKMLNETNETKIIYGLYNIFDLEERARKINAFHPDLTLIIHYNVHESNEPDKEWYLKPQPKNFSMAFVPGSYMKGELARPEWRYEFLCKLFTPDLEESVQLSAAVTRQFEKHLEVPLMEWDTAILYLENASIRTSEKGVFCRNLGLNRQVMGTLCFGESLYQDNLVESGLLNRKDFVVHGVAAPERVRQVARAYLHGVRDWYLGEGK